MSRGGPPPVIERDDGRVIDLTTAIGRHRRIDTAFEIYLGLYQAVTGPEERQKLFRLMSVIAAAPPRIRLGAKSWNTSPDVPPTDDEVPLPALFR